MNSDSRGIRTDPQRRIWMQAFWNLSNLSINAFGTDNKMLGKRKKLKSADYTLCASSKSREAADEEHSSQAAFL
jgi:hypothetical protein